MLRGEANGQDVVEGLVLHEIGHHVYHRGEVPRGAVASAHKEGIGHLLNLVADEHLERNLRAIDPSYGDRLKRLGAYAFQHAPQEIAVAGAARLAARRDRTGADPARRSRSRSTRTRCGCAAAHVLGELDRAGHPLARFARAFRLGLGNRDERSEARRGARAVARASATSTCRSCTT